MPGDERLSRKNRLTGLMAKVYLDPKIRALMAGLPGGLSMSGSTGLSGAGTAISMFDAFLVAQLSQVATNRERLAERTDAKMEVLYDSGRFDERIFEDPDFKGVVFQAAVAAAQETDDAKIEWYAAILAGAASKHRPKDFNLRALLSSMTFLTADELRLARQFYEEFHQSKSSIVDGAPTPSWGPDTSLYLRRLESANLIVSQVVEALPARFQGTAGNYFVTSTFHRLMELVRQTEPPL